MNFECSFRQAFFSFNRLAIKKALNPGPHQYARQHDSMYPVEPKSQSEGVYPVLIILCDTIRRISLKMNTNGKIES